MMFGLYIPQVYSFSTNTAFKKLCDYSTLTSTQKEDVIKDLYGLLPYRIKAELSRSISNYAVHLRGHKDAIEQCQKNKEINQYKINCEDFIKRRARNYYTMHDVLPSIQLIKGNIFHVLREYRQEYKAFEKTMCGDKKINVTQIMNDIDPSEEILKSIDENRLAKAQVLVEDYAARLGVEIQAQRLPVVHLNNSEILAQSIEAGPISLLGCVKAGYMNLQRSIEDLSKGVFTIIKGFRPNPPKMAEKE
jgi:hypothetical protein